MVHWTRQANGVIGSPSCLVASRVRPPTQGVEEELDLHLRKPCIVDATLWAGAQRTRHVRMCPTPPTATPLFMKIKRDFTYDSWVWDPSPPALGDTAPMVVRAYSSYLPKKPHDAAKLSSYEKRPISSHRVRHLGPGLLRHASSGHYAKWMGWAHSPLFSSLGIPAVKCLGTVDTTTGLAPTERTPAPHTKACGDIDCVH